MATCNDQRTTMAAETASVTVGTISADAAGVQDLITGIRSESDDVRTAAWLRAGESGAPAVGPLSEVLTEKSPEVVRAAGRALWRIVRCAGRPGADSERRAVSAELVRLLSNSRLGLIRREVLWMLSEIGGAAAVPPVAAFLADQDLREDARMSLERIPGDESLRELRQALDTASQDFKASVAQSLRRRGVKVAGFPSAKLTPTRQTQVREL